jgi:hypothetical protein
MFEFTFFSFETEAHLVVRTTFVDMLVRTIKTFSTIILYKLETNFKIVTEITFFSITALTCGLIFIARLDFTFVVRARTVIIEFAFTMNELFTHTVCGNLTKVLNRKKGLRVFR